MNNELSSPRFEKPVERRSFLAIAAVASFFGTIISATIGALRLPIPTVFPEADRRFPIGKPEDFPKGEVVHLPSRRLLVISDDHGVAALSMVCPHLGCLVDRQDNGNYTCPCHGSRFDAEGAITGGPSPRGLMWFEVSLGPDGRLVVDSGREVSPDTRFRA
ncbi:MAG: QcrA and Rieske domain-containing protein [Planctomycetota bacterium]|jgi:cytochrome b6-f complex iron-sulfur subunit